MGPSPILALLALLATGSAKQCYDCGYQINGWKPDGPNQQEKLPEVALCGDTANWGNNAVDCGAEEECCGVVREFFVTEASEGLPERVDVQARHACETTLVTAFGKYPEFICKDHLEACFNHSMADIPEHEATFATACFCEGDKCNNDIPVMPDPPTTQSTAPQPSRTCYNCGYKCTDMKDGNCSPEPIDEEGHVPFCGDSASMSSQTKECSGFDECCGAIREYFEVEIEGDIRVDMITFHGCEKDLAGALGGTVEVICKEHEQACYNVSREDIQNDFGQFATACFCEGDRCNNEIPNLPFPPVPSPKPPTDQPGTTKTCYNCGYKCNDLTDVASCVPAPIDPEGKIPFCGERPSMASQTKQCGGGDECCGAIREYFEFTYAGTTKVDMITFHGCEKDLAGALQSNLEVICDSHANSCYNISRDNIQDDFLIEASACFCDGDRCNNNLPGLDFPPAIGGASLATASILSITMASLFLN